MNALYEMDSQCYALQPQENTVKNEGGWGFTMTGGEFLMVGEAFILH